MQEESMSPIRQSSGQGTGLLSNYNPMTRTYFKCSIYSPSNRLYTVDEVNSNFSGDPMSSSKFVHSGFRISGNNPMQNHLSQHKNSNSFVMATSLNERLTESPESEKSQSDTCLVSGV